MVLELFSIKKPIHIMKSFILLVGSLFFSGVLAAQAPEFDDLKILYADGDYEKLCREADKYTQDDKTKKEPLPYYWLAKGLYQISLSSTDDEKFKNAYKEAITAYSKFVKTDKENTYQEEFAEFKDEIQKSLMERINNELSVDNARKAYSWVIKYKKLSNNLIGEMYLEGACKFKSDDKSTGFTLWRDADKAMSELTSMDTWSETDKTMLKIGVLQAAECYVSIRQESKAKDLLNRVAQWFEGDEDFKARYDEIVN